jgi:iron complex transport system substrate-binding protein
MKRLMMSVGQLALTLLTLLTACTAAPEIATTMPVTATAEVASTQIVVEDVLGRSITFDGPPQRMVIAGKSNFMLNDAIYAFPEAPDHIVALTRAKQTTTPFLSYLDPAYEDKLKLTSESTAEEIAATQPDVVFLKQMMQKSVGDALEAVGIPVVYLGLETPEQYQSDIGVLGQLFGDPARADEIRSFYRTRADRIAAGVADLGDATPPTVLLLQYSTSATDATGNAAALEVPPSTWIQSKMVEMSGGTPVWFDASQGGWAVVNLEQIAAWNPDLIFVISYFENVDDAVATLRSDPNWQGLSAVQSGRIYGFPGDFYSWDQPDSRWILGLTWMATRIHPETFADIDMNQEIQAFYGDLYGLDAATVDAEILPLVVGDVAP